MHGKKTLAYLVAAISASIVVLFLVYGYERTWHLWNIPTMSPSFADARVLTAGAESRAAGHDALVDNFKDPWGRPVNYPRIWQWLSYLGIDQSDTVAVGVLFAALFFTSIFLVVDKIGHRTAWLMTCGIFSPAALLALERGNNDLVIFFLLAVAVVAVRRSTLPSLMLIGSAFVLKLYPIFAVSIFLRKHKERLRILLLASAAVAAAYAVLMIDELKVIRNKTPEPLELSYGIDVVWMQLGNLIPGNIVRAVSYVAVIAIGACSVLQGGGRAFGDPDPHLDAFRLGSSIYAGTFMMGANWDYRLIFLLFTIPQLMVWTKSTDAWVKRTAALTLTGSILALWSLISYRLLEHIPLGVPAYFTIDGLAKWSVFAGLVYLFAASCPNYLTYRPNSKLLHEKLLR